MSSFRVIYGKTAAARRTLPMTSRVRSVLLRLWQSAGKPESGYVWPAKTKSGYVNDETIRRAHLDAVRASGVRHFVLHSIRHTFFTRLGESGCDVWTLARVAGHASIKVSSHYVHPSQDAAETAILRLGASPPVGTKLGTTENEPLSIPAIPDQADSRTEAAVSV